MASPRGNPVVIGGFAVGALAIAVVAVILFGSGRLFEKTRQWVAYFDHSVTGLDVGAPVIFRGATVGSVKRIEAIVNPDDLGVFVPVYFETIPASITIQGAAERDVEGVKRFISGGLRAQLKTQSFITGKLYLDLDLHPDTPANYKKLDPEVNEMPTVPSEMQEIQREVRELFAKLSELPLEDLVKPHRLPPVACFPCPSDPTGARDEVARISATTGGCRLQARYLCLKMIRPLVRS